jgi:hypothetical protein
MKLPEKPKLPYHSCEKCVTPLSECLYYRDDSGEKERERPTGVYGVPCKKFSTKMEKLETFEEDVACIRACLERILNHMNSQLFLDYQKEKFGRIIKGKVD